MSTKPGSRALPSRTRSSGPIIRGWRSTTGFTSPTACAAARSSIASSTDQEPINISGMDFRFDPLTGKAEAVSGNGQFGLCFDDWGNRFICTNRNPVPARRDRRPLPQGQSRRDRAGHVMQRRRRVRRAVADLSDQPGLDDVEPARRAIHGGLRRLYLSRRPAAGGVQRQRLHLRPDRQPGPPRDHAAGGADVHVASRPTKARSSSPRPTNGSAR